MNIVFCTTCKERTLHLERTLPQNIKDNPEGNIKFVVLDYNSQDHLASFIKDKFSRELSTGKLAFYQFKKNTSFKMAHAKNMAHRLGILEGADILVNVDADNYTGLGFGNYIRDKFNTHGDGIFLWARMIKENGENKLPRGIGGRIVVTKNGFLNVGGYDEKYDTYSPDDKDFNFRLKRTGYIPLEIDKKFLNAILHSNRIRFREYKHVEETIDENLFELEHEITRVVNFGNIGLGTVYKNFDDTPIEIKRVPTRIFNIGLHKTATNSFAHAMEILKFSSGHWKNAYWARKVWEEVTTFGTSLAMEKYYALSDLPIPLLYKELDANYPNSKFILTIRNKSSWIESMKKHWNEEYNPYRKNWNNDCFTNKVHKLLYGRKDFDEKTFLERYKKHNREVIEYFRGRKDDFMILNMESKRNHWIRLCEFLGVPVPNYKYPVKYVSYK